MIISLSEKQNLLKIILLLIIFLKYKLEMNIIIKESIKSITADESNNNNCENYSICIYSYKYTNVSFCCNCEQKYEYNNASPRIRKLGEVHICRNLFIFIFI